MFLPPKTPQQMSLKFNLISFWVRVVFSPIFVYLVLEENGKTIKQKHTASRYYAVSQKTSPTFSTVTWKAIIRFW